MKKTRKLISCIVIIFMILFGLNKVFALESKYEDFNVLGQIEIPKTNISYPILEKATAKSLDSSVVKLYGVDINQVGNVVIIGHNYRNGLFFSNNKKLEIGDDIYITGLEDVKEKYIVYNKFETTPEDTSFYSRDTNGVPEITLSSCTDDSEKRLIIQAKSEGVTDWKNTRDDVIGPSTKPEDIKGTEYNGRALDLKNGIIKTFIPIALIVLSSF